MTAIETIIALNFSTDLRFITEAPSLKCLQKERATSLYKSDLCSFDTEDKIYDDSQV